MFDWLTRRTRLHRASYLFLIVLRTLKMIFILSLPTICVTFNYMRSCNTASCAPASQYGIRMNVYDRQTVELIRRLLSSADVTPCKLVNVCHCFSFSIRLSGVSLHTRCNERLSYNRNECECTKNRTQHRENKGKRSSGRRLALNVRLLVIGYAVRG